MPAPSRRRQDRRLIVAALFSLLREKRGKRCKWELHRRKFRSIYIYPFESPFISHREEMHNAKAKLNFVSPVDKQKCSSRGLNLLFFVESFFRELVERSTWKFYTLPEEQWVTVGHGVNGSVPRSRCSAWTVCRGLDCTSRARDPEKEGAWSAFHGLPRN